MFVKASPIAVYVSDLERALAFYTGPLGFTLRAQVSPTLCFLVSKGGGLHVYLEGGHRPAEVTADSVRLGFFLQTEGTAREAFDALAAAGVRLLDDEPEEVGDGHFVFRVADPDGNILDVTGRG